MKIRILSLLAGLSLGIFTGCADDHMDVVFGDKVNNENESSDSHDTNNDYSGGETNSEEGAQ
jgi:hypothetical protein